MRYPLITGNENINLIESDSDYSGFISLPDGYDAFSARMSLADQATSTLDLQYYLWEYDLTGSMMLNAIYRAAERGVRVRVLLDDLNNKNMDEILTSFHAHPFIQIRLFNPLKNRKWRFLGNIFDFSRLNRRMHNKSFTSDNKATIIGGRNISDEYYNVGKDFLFIDLDILAVGPVVEDVTRVFENFWNSAVSYPVDEIVENDPGKNDIATSTLVEVDDQEAQIFKNAIKKSKLAGHLSELSFEWKKIRLVSDTPSKITDPSSGQMHLSQAILKMAGMPSRELQIIVPYFVPGKEGLKFFTDLSKNNVSVKILTNAFEATDVAIIHAGYSKYRKKLLKAGVELYELKRSTEAPSSKGSVLTSSSASSLHAKTFSVDRSQVFIGSCNFDPRSSLLNTEMGFLIDSPSMADETADLFNHSIPEKSYKVCLSRKGKLQWVSQSNGLEITHEKEPGLDIFHRMGVSIFSKLPIEWLL